MVIGPPEIVDIKRRRNLLGITQKVLASQAGVSQSIVAKIESGNVSPSYHTAKMILSTLDEMEGKQKIEAKDIMSSRIIYMRKIDSVEKAINTMKKSDCSQLPVLENGHPVGTISERTVFNLISSTEKVKETLRTKVGEVMDDSLPTIRESESLETVSSLLRTNPAVLVVDNGKVKGIITKSDIFKIVKK